MGRPWHLIVLGLIANVLAGCAGFQGYMIDRGRDAADIVTFTMGGGAGAKGRVGPLQTGLLFSFDLAGLCGGGWQEAGEGDRVLNTIDINWIVGGTQNFVWDEKRDHWAEMTTATVESNSAMHAALKWYVTMSGAGGRQLGFWSDNGPPPVPFLVVIPPPDPYMAAFRSMVAPQARKPLFHPFYTQVEVVGGLVGTLRVGLNPGEFVDFLLGFARIDFFDDDTELPKAKPTATGRSEKANSPENDGVVRSK